MIMVLVADVGDDNGVSGSDVGDDDGVSGSDVGDGDGVSGSDVGGVVEVVVLMPDVGGGGGSDVRGSGGVRAHIYISLTLSFYL